MVVRIRRKFIGNDCMHECSRILPRCSSRSHSESADEDNEQESRTV
jgi:hypothetical protein